MTQLKKPFLLVLAAVAFLVATAVPASAHAVLEGSTPAPGASVKTSPKNVVLRFSEPITVPRDGVKVFDGKGNAVKIGAVGRENRSTSTVSIALPKLGDGQYVVTYQIVSDDGHPVDGSIVFAVGDSPVNSSATALAQRLQSETTGTNRVVTVVYAIVRFLVFASLALLVGAAAFLVLVWPEGWSSVRVRRTVWTGWTIAFVTTVVGIGLQGAYTTNGTLADAVKPSVIGDVLDTRFGHAWFARAVMLLLAYPLLVAFERRGTRNGPLPYVGLVLGAAILMTPALSGHASTGRWVALAVPLDALHVMAMSVWLGGLVLLAIEVLRGDDLDIIEPAMDRFSRLAMIAVGALIATGTFQAIRQVEHWDNLLHTNYGRLLLVKLGAFAAVLVVASASRDIVRHEVRRSARLPMNPLPAGPGAKLATPDVPDAEDTVQRLRSAVRYEVLFAVAVLAVTALLVNAAPVRGDTAKPYVATVQSNSAKRISYELEVTPARVGPNQVHITAIDPNGVAQPLVDIQVTLSNPSKGVAPFDVKLLRIGTGGHYQSTGVSIPFPGRWRLEVRGFVTDVDEAAVTGEFDVAS